MSVDNAAEPIASYLAQGTIADKALISAPGIDANVAASGLALLLDGLTVLRGRRPRSLVRSFLNSRQSEAPT
jgi:hypothetical protein